MNPTKPLVVVDDDPTGTQTMAGVRVLLRLDRAAMLDAARDPVPAVHLMTNSRAERPEAARALVASACRGASEVWPDSEIVLRGDSTLRGYVLEEYEALRDVRFSGVDPVLLLAPALPEAGRITADGVHMLERADGPVPLHETEYARDPALGYRDARLLAWAEERSAGRFVAADGLHIALAELREGGAGAVLAALEQLVRQGGPRVCATDARSTADLEHVAAAYFAARQAGLPVILRCAPTLAGIASGATATELAPMPRTGCRVLVVCGSFVPTATRQLAALAAGFPDAMVEPTVDDLAGEPARAADRHSDPIHRMLEADGLAVLTSPRPDEAGPGGVARQGRVAASLAAIVAGLDRPPDVLVTKGGITSAVTIGSGLGAWSAEVVGPVATGVGRWHVEVGDHEVECLVVPGNVGDDRLLLDLVAGLRHTTEGGRRHV